MCSARGGPEFGPASASRVRCLALTLPVSRNSDMIAPSPCWICALALLQCCLIGLVSGRVIFEEADESVVSIYTTVAPPATKHIPDIYHQIASNVVDRVRDPIYKIFGIQKNETTNTTSKPEAQPQKQSKKIEILDETNPNQNEVNPIDNEIDVGDRDVEEISKEHLDKQSKRKKPERLLEKTELETKVKNDNDGEIKDLNTFANDFFDTNSDLQSTNATTTSDPDAETFDDDFDNPAEKAEGNPFSYVVEWLNNLLSLFWGFVDVLWAPDTSS